MSKFTEYLKLIPKGLKNPQQVLEGWINDYNFDNLPKEEVEEILKRRAICEQCPFNSLNAKTSKEYFDVFQKHYETERDDLHCSVCACPIKTKTASLDSECGLSADDKTKDLQLKWNKYNEQTK
jgi:hypothetical protein